MKNFYLTKLFILDIRRFLEKAMESYNEAMDKLTKGENAITKFLESELYINTCIRRTEFLLKINSETSGILDKDQKEEMLRNLQNMKDELQKIEEMINYLEKQQVETL